MVGPRQIAKSNRLDHTVHTCSTVSTGSQAVLLQKMWSPLLHIVPPICSWAGLHGLGAIRYRKEAAGLEKYQQPIRGTSSSPHINDLHPAFVCISYIPGQVTKHTTPYAVAARHWRPRFQDPGQW